VVGRDGRRYYLDIVDRQNSRRSWNGSSSIGIGAERSVNKSRKSRKVSVGVEANRRKESIKEGRPQRLNEGILLVGRRRRRGRVGERAVRCEGEVKRASAVVAGTDRFVSFGLTGWRVGRECGRGRLFVFAAGTHPCSHCGPCGPCGPISARLVPDAKPQAGKRGL
jgi:hypothetical protein